MGLSGGHIIILLIIVLLLFGAKRIPELGSSLGKGIRSFKKGMEGIESDEEDENESQKLVAHEKRISKKQKKVTQKEESES